MGHLQTTTLVFDSKTSYFFSIKFQSFALCKKKLQVRCMSWSPKDYVNDYYFKRVLHTIWKKSPFFKFAISKPEIDLVVGTSWDF